MGGKGGAGVGGVGGEVGMEVGTYEQGESLPVANAPLRQEGRTADAFVCVGGGSSPGAPLPRRDACSGFFSPGTRVGQVLG